MSGVLEELQITKKYTIYFFIILQSPKKEREKIKGVAC